MLFLFYVWVLFPKMKIEFCHVVRAGLVIHSPTASVSWVLGLQAYDPMPRYNMTFNALSILMILKCSSYTPSFPLDWHSRLPLQLLYLVFHSYFRSDISDMIQSASIKTIGTFCYTTAQWTSVLPANSVFQSKPFHAIFKFCFHVTLQVFCIIYDDSQFGVFYEILECMNTCFLCLFLLLLFVLFYSSALVFVLSYFIILKTVFSFFLSPHFLRKL